MTKTQNTIRANRRFETITSFLTTFLSSFPRKAVISKTREISELFEIAKNLLKKNFNVNLGVRSDIIQKKNKKTPTLRFYFQTACTPAVEDSIEEIKKMTEKPTLFIRCNDNKNRTTEDLKMITLYLQSLIFISMLKKEREAQEIKPDANLLINFAKMARKAETTVTKKARSEKLVIRKKISSKITANPDCGTKLHKRKKTEKSLVFMKQNKKHQPQEDSAVDTTTQLIKNNELSHRQEARHLWKEWSSNQKASHSNKALKL